MDRKEYMRLYMQSYRESGKKGIKSGTELFKRRMVRLQNIITQTPLVIASKRKKIDELYLAIAKIEEDIQAHENAIVQARDKLNHLWD